MRMSVLNRGWRLGITVLTVALAPASGCGVGGRSAEYTYEPWNVAASGAAGPAIDAAAVANTPNDLAGGAESATSPIAVDDPAAGATGDNVDALRAQVRELRQREQMLLHALDAARAEPPRQSSREGQDAVAEADSSPSSAQAAAEHGSSTAESTEIFADRIAGLHAELAEERRRRQAAEMQLERLRRETSQAPFGAPTVPESAFLAAKQEIVYLRQALAEEKLARQRLAEDFGALQRELARRPATASPAADSRRAELEHRTGEAAASFQRTLTATDAETAALDRELAEAATGAEDDDSAVRAENALLRQRLEEQRRRTEDLAAKLKLAVRVTDLIFKLEGQQRASTTRSARQSRSASTRAVKSRRTAAAPPPADPASAAAPAPVPAPAEPSNRPRPATSDPPYPI